jgi:hypothetical protein
MDKYLTGRGVLADAVAGFAVIDLANGEVLATYAEQWRADNHAIAGCPCMSQWHAYHGSRHESEGVLGSPRT